MLLQENGRSITDLKSMPRLNATDMLTFTNKLIIDELNYNKDELKKTHADMLLMLINEQRCVYDKIMESVGSDDGGFFFLYGYSGGRTAHSTLTVPIEINEASSLTIEKDSPREDLVHVAKLIIWDEAPMMHRWCFEAVDRSMRDIMSKNDPLNEFRPFGGKTKVLGGDFMQILHVEILEDLLISDTTNLLMSLIDIVYLDLNDNLGDLLFFQERGILAPTLDSVEHVNEYMMSLIPGEEKEYLSSVSVCRSGENSLLP
ncbi:PIF1-like helicase [Medicago truncatula]|uniref:ATP-dependent DNA helicase n=1 Tax=Medicago truncatula TaxID=3880 RepID=A0A072TZY1_MEDTR|nr:PIF1-like helicase [Medicago truncatula]